VPQFIEVESKVVGPLTLKQFIYIAGTSGLCVVIVLYLPLVFAIILSIPIIALGASLAFYRVNGKPFVNVLEAGFNYYTGAKFFLWKHEDHTAENQGVTASAAAEAEAAANVPLGTPKLTRGKLSDLAWSLDVSTGNTPAVEQSEQNAFHTLKS